MLWKIFGLILCGAGVYCVPVIPEDVPTAFAAIYGFFPPIRKVSDHRFGFGFRFGNHADLQVIYEFGPQLITKPLRAVSRIRSTSHRERIRRPILDFLIKTGLIKKASYKFSVSSDCDDEPR
ncbi:uncharacterized protein LOC114249798 [Bombyx mandarina]|uniref:Uncharacterized protein LOC114249798 n=1 Tax=Bombyx mandarina TaxID=7092 RepID=A0A6J2KEF5_BOMMA|nr:uncharacterized protein LOC114249798 [Bombyx mandarina]